MLPKTDAFKIRTLALTLALVATGLTGIPAATAFGASLSVEFACAEPTGTICNTPCLQVNCYTCTTDCAAVEALRDLIDDIRDCVRYPEWCSGIDVNEIFRGIMDFAVDLVFAILPVLLDLVARAPGIVTDAVAGVQQTIDPDGDNLPDAAEATVCGRAAVRDAINGGDHRITGQCTSTTNYQGPSQASIEAVVADAEAAALAVVAQVLTLVEPVVNNVLAIAEMTLAFLIDEANSLADLVEGAVLQALALIDSDGDGVPNSLEATLCALEDQNTPADGSCVGGNYSPP